MLKKETIPKGSVALLATRGWLQKWGRSGRYSYTVLWKSICALPSFKKLNFLKSFHHVLSDIKLTQHIRKTSYESSPIWWQEFNGRVGWMTVTCWTHRYCSQMVVMVANERQLDTQAKWQTWVLENLAAQSGAASSPSALVVVLHQTGRQMTPSPSWRCFRQWAACHLTQAQRALAWQYV